MSTHKVFCKMEQFETQAHFVKLPQKWIDEVTITLLNEVIVTPDILTIFTVFD